MAKLNKFELLTLMLPVYNEGNEGFRFEWSSNDRALDIVDMSRVLNADLLSESWVSLLDILTGCHVWVLEISSTGKLEFA